MANELQLSVLINATDRFTGPARKIVGASKELQKSMTENYAALRKMEKLQGSLNRFSQASGRLGQKQREFKELGRTIQYLRRQLEISGSSNKGLTKDLDAAVHKSNRMGAAIRQQTSRLNAWEKELKEAGIDTKNLAREQDRLSGSVGKATAKMKRMGNLQAQVEAAKERRDKAISRASSATLIAHGMHNVGSKLTNALKSPISQAIAFESAMADVRKVVNFPTPKGLEILSDQILAMSKRIPIAKEGLAQIAAAGGQLGIAAKDLPSFVETTAKIATAWDMLPDEAGERMAKLSNVYKIPIADIMRLGDTINYLSDNSAAKAAEISNVLLSVGGQGRQFGLTADQLAGLSATFIALGKKPEVAATAINAMLLKLQTAPTQGKKFQKALATIGYSSKQLQREIGQDAQGALLKFLGTLERLDKQSRANVLSELFGMEYSDDISLLAGSLDKYRQTLAMAKDKKSQLNSVEKEFQNRSNTRGNRLQLLQQRWDAVLTKMGEKLFPALDKLVSGLEPIITAIGSWVEQNPKLAATILSITGVVGGLALVLAPVITALGSLAAAIALIGLKSKKSALQAAMLGGGKGAGKGGLLKGAVGVAAAAGTGYEIGTAISENLVEGTKTGDAIGRFLTKTTALLGNKEAQAAVARDDAYRYSISPMALADVRNELEENSRQQDRLQSSIQSLLKNGMAADAPAIQVYKKHIEALQQNAAELQKKLPVDERILKAPKAQALPAAALVGTMAVTPLAAAPPSQHIVENNNTQHNSITINQLPGEDAQAVANRVLAMLKSHNAAAATATHSDGMN